MNKQDLDKIAHQANWEQVKIVYADEIERYAAQQALEALEALPKRGHVKTDGYRLDHVLYEDVVSAIAAIQATLTKEEQHDEVAQ